VHNLFRGSGRNVLGGARLAAGESTALKPKFKPVRGPLSFHHSNRVIHYTFSPIPIKHTLHLQMLPVASSSFAFQFKKHSGMSQSQVARARNQNSHHCPRPFWTTYPVLLFFDVPFKQPLLDQIPLTSLRSTDAPSTQFPASQQPLGAVAVLMLMRRSGEENEGENEGKIKTRTDAETSHASY